MGNMKRREIMLEAAKEIDKLKNLFWEYNFDDVLKDLSNIVVIERVLEFGDKEQVSILFRNLERQKIIEYLETTGIRRLSKKSYNFWKEYFGIANRS